MKGKCPKLQLDLKESYIIIDKINDIIHRIRYSTKCKVIHINKID